MQRQSFRQEFIAGACVALVLLMGCGTSKPRGSSTVTEVPLENTAAVAHTSWQDARVGDRVEYAFYVHASGMSRGNSSSAGQLFVEVVAVRPPWVWLSIRVTRNDGQPHPHPFLRHAFVLPMRMGQAPAHRPPGIRGSPPIPIRAFAAGHHWLAQRTSRDESSGDGPTQHRIYAEPPGPLYLTRGLLEVDSVSGFNVTFGHRLALVSFQRGSGTSEGVLPRMDRPFGPGTWYEMKARTREGSRVTRICLGAEQGYLLRKGWTDSTDGTRCEDFQDAESVALEDALIQLVDESVFVPTWPPRDYGAPLPRQGPLHLGQDSLRAYFDETPDSMDHESLKVTVQGFATDVWNPVLRGLPREARFKELSAETFWQPRAGLHQFIEDTRLSGWGTWLEPSELSSSTR
ncbi:DUF6068 family protein [Corallococcus sp. 4LFB]|uniref:DUF6068 family protein n=1 Tax=Corallococcus sp. 4LFB TaxID=3383249 RepID=UPI00397651C2